MKKMILNSILFLTLFAGTVQAQMIVEGDPAAPYLKEGLELQNALKYNEALSKFNQAIQFSSQSVDAYMFRAKLYVKMGQYKKAKTDLDTIRYFGHDMDEKFLSDLGAGLDYAEE